MQFTVSSLPKWTLPDIFWINDIIPWHFVRNYKRYLLWWTLSVLLFLREVDCRYYKHKTMWSFRIRTDFDCHIVLIFHIAIATQYLLVSVFLNPQLLYKVLEWRSSLSSKCYCRGSKRFTFYSHPKENYYKLYTWRNIRIRFCMFVISESYFISSLYLWTSPFWKHPWPCSPSFGWHCTPQA